MAAAAIVVSVEDVENLIVEGFIDKGSVKDDHCFDSDRVSHRARLVALMKGWHPAPDDRGF